MPSHFIALVPAKEVVVKLVSVWFAQLEHRLVESTNSQIDELLHRFSFKNMSFSWFTDSGSEGQNKSSS